MTRLSHRLRRLRIDPDRLVGRACLLIFAALVLVQLAVAMARGESDTAPCTIDLSGDAIARHESAYECVRGWK